MDHMGSPPLHAMDYNSSTKRKRSLSVDTSMQPVPPAKVPKTNTNQLQINYLARQFSEILPLISTEDPLPSLLSLISDYDGVLQRHESMAGNLGARPLGPILIQRFERLFDGPPRVLKTHGKEGTSVGWLDVVDFAKTKPEQFNLEKMRDGVRVCQFYTKQCRVEISEEDFVLVASGIPQKLIPPQPIAEDEEKELGTLEILEKNLGSVVQLADQVSARARQLNHRLRNRRTAIISRREAEANALDDSAPSPPLRGTDAGSLSRYQSNGDRRASSKSNSPTSGFVAVNSKNSLPDERSSQYNGSPHGHPRSTSAATSNGTSLHGASAATRAELLSKFHTSTERTSSIDFTHTRRSSASVSRPLIPPRPKTKPYADPMEYAGVLLDTASPVPIPNTPSSLLPYVKPSSADRFDDSGPFKADMMARMEQMNRGDRVQPPCDRCRRLHMDCLKNLTACMGCTKKHAKCSWKDVESQELKDHPFVPRAQKDEVVEMGSEGEGRLRGGDKAKRDYSKERQGVRDEELLGEESGDEEFEVVEKPALERHYSAQSLSPLPIAITNEPPPEGLEALPPPDHPSISEAATVSTSQDRTRIRTIGSDNEETSSAPTKLINDLKPASNKTTTSSPYLPATVASTYHPPQAKMQRRPSEQKDSFTFHNVDTDLPSTVSKGDSNQAIHVYIGGSETLDSRPLRISPATNDEDDSGREADRVVVQSQSLPEAETMPTPPMTGQSVTIEGQEVRREEMQI